MLCIFNTNVCKSMSRTRSASSKQGDNRGQQNLVAIILLFGMVFVGATVIFLAGGTLIDALHTNIGTEQVRSTAGSVDNSLWSAAAGGGVFALPEDGYDRIEATDEGEVKVAWHDGAVPDDIDWDDDAKGSELGELRLIYDNSDEEFAELESTSEQTVVAHQGGGIWEAGDNGVRIQSAPDVGVNPDGSVRLNFMKIDPEEVGTSPSNVQGNDAASTETLDELAEVAGEPPENKNHFVIKIESEYADGWERHFEDEAEVTDKAHSPPSSEENVVYLLVEDLGHIDTLANFQIDEERGLSAPNEGEGQSIDDNTLREGPTQEFHIDSTITNKGSEESDVTVTLSIWDGEDEIGSRTIDSKNEIGEGDSIDTNDQSRWDAESGNHFFQVGSSGLKSVDLEPGNRYEYNIETDPGGHSLSDNGTFYYIAEEPSYVVSEAQDSTSGETIEIDGTVENIGANAENRPVDLTISPVDSNQTTETHTDLTLEELNQSTVSWEIDQTQWPNGEYEYNVSTESDPDGEGGTFEVTEGGALEITDSLGIDDGDLVNGTSGQVVDQSEPVTINTNLTNTFTDPVNQTVTLEIYGEDAEVGEDDPIQTQQREPEVDSDETKEVGIGIDPEALGGGIYQYTVATENDAFDEPGEFFVTGDSSDIELKNVALPDDTVKPEESLEAEVTVENQGGSGNQTVWLEGFDGSIVTTETIEFEEDEERTITLEWGSVGIPDSPDNATVTVGTDGVTETEPVAIEPLLLVNDVRIAEKTVLDEQTVDGDVIGQTLDVAVEAEFESAGGDASQTVQLEGFDGEIIETDVTVDAGETTTETIRYETPPGSITDRVTVRTEDDQGDEVVVVRRDGPVCSEVAEPSRDSGVYQIETIDQLQCINENLDADYELVNDIDAHGTQYWNSDGDSDPKGFEPIGPRGHRYTVSDSESRSDWETFEGDFDGNGFLIEGLYIDRPDEEHVGLFGSTWYPSDRTENNRGVSSGEGSTIENVRLADVDIHGYRHVGGLAGQVGGTVEDSRSEGTVKAERQLVGGLVGDGAHGDLDNRLVAEGTVEGGDWDETELDDRWDGDRWNRGIGGLVGRTTYQTDFSTGYTWTDVKGPDMVGGVVGSSSRVESNFDQVYTNGTVTATDERYSGAITGTMEDSGDTFEDSVYHDETIESQTYGEEYRGTVPDRNRNAIGRSTSEMQGLGVNEPGRMNNLDFEEDGGPWVAVPDEYPRFAWELEAEGAFDVEITEIRNAEGEETTDLSAGETATVNVTVTSLYRSLDNETETQTISLANHDGQTVDTELVTLPSSFDKEEKTEETLRLQTDIDEQGTDDIAVRSEDREDTEQVTIKEAENQLGNSDGPSFGELPDGSTGPSDGVDTNTGSTDDTATPQFPTDIEIDVGAVTVG